MCIRDRLRSPSTSGPEGPLACKQAATLAEDQGVNLACCCCCCSLCACAFGAGQVSFIKGSGPSAQKPFDLWPRRTAGLQAGCNAGRRARGQPCLLLLLFTLCVCSRRHKGEISPGVEALAWAPAMKSCVFFRFWALGRRNVEFSLGFVPWG